MVSEEGNLCGEVTVNRRDKTSQHSIGRAALRIERRASRMKKILEGEARLQLDVAPSNKFYFSYLHKKSVQHPIRTCERCQGRSWVM